MTRDQSKSKIRLMCILLGMYLAACADVAPTNPYDPNTPVAQQARSIVSGQLLLPETFDPALQFDGAVVNLASATVADAEPLRALLDAEGRFSFEAVVADVYQLGVTLTGFQPVSMLITVTRGTNLILPGIQLVPSDLSEQSERQWIKGRVTLTGRGDNENEAVRISVVGTPYLTESTVEGLFEIEVPHGTYTLRFNHPDYSELRLADVSVTVGENTDVGEIVLTPFSGSIVIEADVQPNWIPASQRFAYATVERIGGGFARRDLVVRHQEPITVEGVPAGNYTISVTRSGFRPARADDVSITSEVRTVDVVLVLNMETLALTEIDLEGQQLSACDLRQGQVDFRRGDLSGTSLTGSFGVAAAQSCTPSCDEPPCAALNCEIDTCAALDFSRARLTNADFTSNGGATLRGAFLPAADLFGAVLTGVDLSGANLRQANLFGVQAQAAIFAGADLSQSNLSAADLRDAVLGTAMSDQRHESTVTVGADADGMPIQLPHPWSGRRVPALPLYISPCEGAASAIRYSGGAVGSDAMTLTNLQRAVLSQANLTGAFLAGLDLSETVLNGVRLVNADLRGTCLRGSALTLLDFSDALFDGADLRDARLSGSVLYRSSFRGADLRQANLGSTSIELSDFGAWVPLSASDACVGYGANDFRTENCNDNPTAEICQCLTRLDGVDLSGSLIQGSDFENASLTYARFNATILSESIDTPINQPARCDPTAVEVARLFCEMNNACNVLGALTGNNDELGANGLECSSFGQGFGAVAPNEAVGGFLTVPALECLLQVQNDNNECIDGDDVSQLQQYGACFAYADDDGGAGDDIDLGMPPEYPPLDTVCSFEKVVETLSADVAEACSEGDYNAGEDCCPRSFIPYFCSVTETRFNGARLDHSVMRGMVFSLASFNDASLVDVELENSEFLSSNFDGANFTDANLRQSTLGTTSMVGAKLERADFGGATVIDSDWSNTDLNQVNLTEASIRRTRLDGSRMGTRDGNVFETVGFFRFRLGDMNDATLVIRNASWINQKLTRVSLENLRFEGGSFQDLKIEGSELHRVRFKSTPDASVDDDLQGDDLNQFRPDLDLRGAHFLYSSLSGVTFDRVRLADARFEWVSIDSLSVPGQNHPTKFSRIRVAEDTPIIFDNVEMERSLFRAVDLPRSRFLRGSMREVIFGFQSGVRFTESLFANIDIAHTDFRDADLRNAQFASATLGTHNGCGVRLFRDDNRLEGTMFSDAQSSAVMVGIERFPRETSHDFENVCACSSATENVTFLNAAPYTEVEPQCEEHVTDCADLKWCAVELF